MNNRPCTLLYVFVYLYVLHLNSEASSIQSAYIQSSSSAFNKLNLNNNHFVLISYESNFFMLKSCLLSNWHNYSRNATLRILFQRRLRFRFVVYDVDYQEVNHNEKVKTAVIKVSKIKLLICIQFYTEAEKIRY